MGRHQTSLLWSEFPLNDAPSVIKFGPHQNDLLSLSAKSACENQMKSYNYDAVKTLAVGFISLGCPSAFGSLIW